MQACIGVSCAASSYNIGLLQDELKSPSAKASVDVPTEDYPRSVKSFFLHKFFSGLVCI